jgi:CRP/FNR family transcriptional regulator, cyclic AMP receptor protein
LSVAASNTKFQLSSPENIPDLLSDLGCKSFLIDGNKQIDGDLFSGGILFLSYGIMKLFAGEKESQDVFIELFKRGEAFRLDTCYQNIPDTKVVARATTRSMLYFVPDETLEFIGINGSPLNQFFNQIFFQKLCKKEAQNIINVRYDIRQRLKIFLKDYAEDFTSKKSDIPLINNYLSHQEIAQILCSSRQTISMIFNSWRAEHQIDYSRRWIKILNPHFFKSLD